jgi:hypothetical protein
MSQEIYTILYCSRNLVAGGPDQQDEEINHILRTSRVNNSRQNVTGALLFSSGYFAQVLEGPQSAIEQTFERIQRDPRHGDVTILQGESRKQRSFPEWSMAHVQTPNQAQAAGVAEALDLAMANPGAANGEVMDLLRSLVIQED